MNPNSKRSFLKFPITFDAKTLTAEYWSIPATAWPSRPLRYPPGGTNYHPNTNRLMLRGGHEGNIADFFVSNASDHPLLSRMLTLAYILNEPFGPCDYAYLFRIGAWGTSMRHRDLAKVWNTHIRIHVPLATNDGAWLLCEGRAIHFAVGEAWTFDNQQIHGVLNGSEVRAHLLMDVPLNSKLEQMLAEAEFHPGLENPELWECTYPYKTIAPPATFLPLKNAEKQALGLSPKGFARRVSMCRPAAMMPSSLQAGDIVYAVNGVEEHPDTRNVMAYIDDNWRPAAVVSLGVIRAGEKLTVPLALFPRIASVN